MTEPTDWTPLFPYDPFEAANPDTVAEFAEELEATRKRIEESVCELRKLENAEHWSTEAADAFRDKARTTRESISRAEGRYSTTKTNLDAWAETLREGKTTAEGHLAEAKENQQVLDSTPEPDDGGLFTPKDLTPEEEADKQAREQAEQRIEELRQNVYGVLAGLHEEARVLAENIRRGADDELTDSFWDNIQQWIQENAGWLRAVAEVLSWAAAIVGIIAIFVSGAWIVALVIGIASLVVTLVLFAGGEASLAEVGLAIFGVVTAGIGKAASKTATTAFKSVAGPLQKTRGAAAMKTVLGAPRNVFGRMPGGRQIVSGWRHLVSGPLASRAAQKAVPGELLEQAGKVPVSRFVFGSRETAQRFHIAKDWMRNHQHSSAHIRQIVTELGEGGSPHLRTAGETLRNATRVQGINNVVTTTKSGIDISQADHSDPKQIVKDINQILKLIKIGIGK